MENSLNEYYKFVYVCDTDGCTNAYGSDKEEKGEHFCPICEDKIKRKGGKIKYGIQPSRLCSSRKRS